MKDWLGNEYDVGDKVVYAAMSGRSVTMVLAEVVNIYKAPKHSWSEDYEEKVTKVTVQPLKSSRWEQHYGRTRYRDTRTGKYIDPFRAPRVHGVGGYWENETGEKVYDDFVSTDLRFRGYRYWDASSAPKGWIHTPWKFKDYVQEVKEGPGTVTLSVTDNIMKWGFSSEA